MHYFWQGGAQGCLGTDKDFLRINKAITQIYFASRMRTFQRYLSLPQPQRTEWAEKLLQGVTTPAMLMRLVLTKESSAIRKYIIMLKALDKDGGFDQRFIKSVNSAVTTLSAKRLGTADFASVEEFLIKTLQKLVDPENAMKSTIMDNLRADIAELEAHDPDTWINLSGSLVEIATELADLAVSLKNVPWEQKLDLWKRSAQERFPTNERAARFYCEVGTFALTVLNAGFAVFELIGDVENWSEMEPDQKVAAVSNAIKQVAVVGDGVRSFVKFLREPAEPVSIEMDIFRWQGDWSVLPEETIGSEAWEQALARNATKAVRYDIAVFMEPLNALAVVVTVISMVSLGCQISRDGLASLSILA